MAYLKFDDPIISRHKVENQRKIIGIHFHDKYELYYLVNGSTKYFVGDETYVLEKGNLIFIPPHTMHSCDSEDALHNERMLLSIPEDFCDKSTSHIFEELGRCKYIYIPPENLHIVDELFNKINKEYSKNKEHKDILIKLYIQQLLTLLCRLKKDYRPVVSQTDEIIREISDYIKKNYSSPLTLKSLSSLFAISEGHLSRQFKSVTGVGLSEFIAYVRITNAEKILKSSKIPITEVAALCGYNDSNYFAAVFKKFKGITPYRYSKQNLDL